jgi:dephospho-CoA kinase
VVLGLIGGIAAGKSAVAECFERHGLARIDADAEARAAAGEPEILARIAAEFGPELVVEGRLDRAAAARVVFADPAARARFEAILHPRIRQRILAALAAAKAAGRSALLDAPLLLEGGLVAWCDRVVFVEADAATRRARAAARGWADGEWERREAAQLPVAEKRSRADFVIRNDGSLDDTARQVSALLATLVTP